MAQRNLPDLFQGGISVCSGVGGGISVLHGCRRRGFLLGKLYAVGFRLGPRFSKVVGRTHVRAPVRAVDCGPKAVAAFAIVIGKSVNGSTGKIGAADLPILTFLI